MKSLQTREGFSKTFSRKEAIKRVLMTPKQIKQKEREDKIRHEWYSKIESSDPEVLKKLFQKEWPLFEVCVDNKKDVKRLKKMFEIK